MSNQVIKVVEALKQAGEPLSGQELLAAAGLHSDSDRSIGAILSGYSVKL